MRYMLRTDQKKAIEWKLTRSEADIFSICFEAHSWADPIVIDEKVFYFLSRNKVIEEAPLVTQMPDTVYRIFKSLASKGLIAYDKVKGKDCIRVTEKGKGWNCFKLGNESESNSDLNPDSEMNPSKLGNESESNSDLNPTYNSTIIDNSTRDKAENPPLENFSLKNIETPFPDCAAPHSPKKTKQSGMKGRPEQEDVETYFRELYTDPKWKKRFAESVLNTSESFFNYHESKGWRIGSQPMKNWKAACRTWLLNNERFGRIPEKPKLVSLPGSYQNEENNFKRASADFARKLAGYE